MTKARRAHRGQFRRRPSGISPGVYYLLAGASISSMNVWQIGPAVRETQLTHNPNGGEVSHRKAVIISSNGRIRQLRLGAALGFTCPPGAATPRQLPLTSLITLRSWFFLVVAASGFRADGICLPGTPVVASCSCSRPFRGNRPDHPCGLTRSSSPATATSLSDRSRSAGCAFPRAVIWSVRQPTSTASRPAARRASSCGRPAARSTWCGGGQRRMPASRYTGISWHDT